MWYPVKNSTFIKSCVYYEPATKSQPFIAVLQDKTMYDDLWNAQGQPILIAAVLNDWGGPAWSWSIEAHIITVDETEDTFALAL